jgi:hypothetical protein
MAYLYINHREKANPHKKAETVFLKIITSAISSGTGSEHGEKTGYRFIEIKEKAPHGGPLEPREGIEPSTYHLRSDCSAD